VALQPPDEAPGGGPAAPAGQDLVAGASLAVATGFPQDGRFIGSEEARMDQARARALLDGERARLERLLATGSGQPQQADLGDEVDDADRRDAAQTGAAVDQLLRARWEALERAEARLAAGSYGRSVRSGQPIPDERLEADPLAELTIAEAAAAERDAGEDADGEVGLVSSRHPFEVLGDADITPEEQLAGEADDDEPAPGQSQGIHVERDDRPR
jgi:DnaK suppressor protein